METVMGMWVPLDIVAQAAFRDPVQQPTRAPGGFAFVAPAKFPSKGGGCLHHKIGLAGGQLLLPKEVLQCAMINSVN